MKDLFLSVDLDIDDESSQEFNAQYEVPPAVAYCPLLLDNKVSIANKQMKKIAVKHMKIIFEQIETLRKTFKRHHFYSLTFPGRIPAKYFSFDCFHLNKAGHEFIGNHFYKQFKKNNAN